MPVDSSSSTAAGQWKWLGIPEKSISSTNRNLECSDHLLTFRCRKCTRLWREAHFQVKSVKKLTGSDHFWTFRCRKSARSCDAKDISKSKGSKTDGSDHFFTIRCRCVWQAQRIAHLVKSEQNVRVLWQFQIQPPVHANRPHDTPLHYTQLH